MTEKKGLSQEDVLKRTFHTLCTRLKADAEKQVRNWMRKDKPNFVFDGAYCQGDRLVLGFSGKEAKKTRDLSTADMNAILAFMTGPFSEEVAAKAKNNGLDVRVVKQQKTKEQYVWAVEPKRSKLDS